jgi:polygalacturonase
MKNILVLALLMFPMADRKLQGIAFGLLGPCSITSFGAVGDGKTNNLTAIQNAFNYASENHCTVLIPAGTFAYSGLLTATGIAVQGAGATSILNPTNSVDEAIELSGNGDSISNLVMISKATVRLTTPWSGMIWANGATNYSISNVLIDGSSSIGIMSYGSSNGKITNNTIENTLADSITQIAGANNITVSGNRTLNSGDDGISTVSYVGGPAVYDITVKGNTVLDNLWGRGITVVGGNNVTFSGNYVDNPDLMSDIYIGAESESGTLGVSGAVVSNNTLMAGGYDQGTITIYNSQGATYAITGVTVSGNQIVKPLLTPVQFVGNGSESGSFSNNTAYATGVFNGNSDNPLAVFKETGNKVLEPSAYTTPLVAPGGGCNFSGC